MRVGSRWLHYLLAELLGMEVSGEIDVKNIEKQEKTIRDHFKDNRIVKFHHATELDILEKLKPHNYKIIGTCRCPRDRTVSKAFHERYKKRTPAGWTALTKVQKAETDFDAIVELMKLPYYWDNTSRMLRMMKHGYSTMRHMNLGKPYIWTTYEWMKEDIVREIVAILDFLGVDVPKEEIEKVCNKNSFETKCGRTPGTEVRQNIWRRKGVIGDWENWFNQFMKDVTANYYIDYKSIIRWEKK